MAAAMSLAAIRGRQVLSSYPSSSRGAPMSNGEAAMASRAASVIVALLPSPTPTRYTFICPPPCISSRSAIGSPATGETRSRLAPLEIAPGGDHFPAHKSGFGVADKDGGEHIHLRVLPQLRQGQ